MKIKKPRDAAKPASLFLRIDQPHWMTLGISETFWDWPIMIIHANGKLHISLISNLSSENLNKNNATKIQNTTIQTNAIFCEPAASKSSTNEQI